MTFKTTPRYQSSSPLKECINEPVTRWLAAGVAWAVLLTMSVGVSRADAAGVDVDPFGGVVSDAGSIAAILGSTDYQQEDGSTLRLYRAFLNREPDLEGAKYWIAQSRSGANPDDLSYGFAQSTEFVTRYGTLSNSEFLTILYDNMLGRSPDAGGFAYWLNKMDTGELSQHGVVRWIVANPEFEARLPYTDTALQCGTFSVEYSEDRSSPDIDYYLVSAFDPPFDDCLVNAGYHDRLETCTAPSGWSGGIEGTEVISPINAVDVLYGFPSGTSLEEGRIYREGFFSCRGRSMRLTWTLSK